MYDSISRAVTEAKHVLVIQAENPDGDSLGSSLALEEILGDLGKKVTMYCPVDIPKYLRYANGWDRVVSDWPHGRGGDGVDLVIIVDTGSETLLQRAIIPEQRSLLTKVPVLMLDHHETESDLSFPVTAIVDPTCVATGELIARIARDLSWPVNATAADSLCVAILSDSLGLTTPGTTAESIRTVAHLVECGASLNGIENRRREYMKKSAEILRYKGRLIERIEYHLDGQLALVHIPWNEIELYSDQYNPTMLVLDEMRLVRGVRVAIGLKTYPDHKVTAKIRANADSPVAERIAGFFGGGGHAYAAGFRVYDEDYTGVLTELIRAVDETLSNHDQKEYDDAAAEVL